MATFDHKGTTITLSDRGDFTATDCNGKFVRAASLDAMKKRLDNTKASSFEPFTALELDFYLPRYADENGGGITVIKVTAVEKVRQRFGDGYCFNVERPKTRWGPYSGTETSVYADTPECRAAYHTYMKLRAKHDALKKSMDEAESAARAALTLIKASEYKAPAKKA